MEDLNFWIGVLGAVVLVTGAAWPSVKISKPWKSTKNWLFTVGALIMLAYAILNYLDGGPIFFVILQLFANATSVLMMLDAPDKVDVPVIITLAIGMIVWSLSLFEDYSTVLFVLGISGIGLGYAFDYGSMRREAALTIGSVLIAIFSYIVGDYIFLGLNVAFGLFSGYYFFSFFLRRS